MKNKPSFILKVSCPGRSGIVAAIGNFLADRACFIKELHQYDDLDFGRFFCTIEFFFEGDQKPRVEQLRAAFEMTALGFDMEWAIHDASQPTKVLIGATAHYVTADLDEGPIIEQMVERVKHSHDAEHLTLVGRDTEAQTLARAVKNHVRHRVFLNGLRTVVF